MGESSFGQYVGRHRHTDLSSHRRNGNGWRQVLKPVMRRGDEIGEPIRISSPDGRTPICIGLAEATHADLSRVSRRIQAYIATNSRLFFDMYLGGDESARGEIGRVMTRHRPSP